MTLSLETIFLVLIIPWGTWVTARLMGVMTRKEHAAICSSRNASMMAEIEALHAAQVRRDDEDRVYREKVTDQLGVLLAEIARLSERTTTRTTVTSRRRY